MYEGIIEVQVTEEDLATPLRSCCVLEPDAAQPVSHGRYLVEFVPFLMEGEKSITLAQLIERASILNARGDWALLNALLRQQQKIPKRLEGVGIVAPGVILRCRNTKKRCLVYMGKSDVWWSDDYELTGNFLYTAKVFGRGRRLLRAHRVA